MYLLNEDVHVELYSERERLKGKMNKHAWLPLTLTFDPYRAWKTNSCPVLVGNLQCSVPIPLSVRTLRLYLFPVGLGILLPPFTAVHLKIESFLYFCSATMRADNRKASHISLHYVRSVKVVLILLPLVKFAITSSNQSSDEGIWL